MELAYLLPCANIIRDEKTRKFSYIDIFQAIAIPKGLTESFTIFSVGGKIISVPAGATKVEVSVIDPDGVNIATAVLQGTLAVGDLDIAADFIGVKLTKTGRFFFKVKFNGAPVEDNGRFYFDVVKES